MSISACMWFSGPIPSFVEKWMSLYITIVLLHHNIIVPLQLGWKLIALQNLPLLFFSEEEINGAAFKDLSSEELEEMGFKRGPRKNIMNIIKDLKQTDAEA